jgi:hypothetical protein
VEKDSMNSDFQEKDGFYSYPINCPACQDSPDVEPDENLARNCEICKGIGEITLQMTEEELADLYKHFIGLMENEGKTCPFMGKGATAADMQGVTTCPYSGAKITS